MISLSLMLFTMAAAAFQAPAPTVKDVAWIAGCWDYTRNTRHVTEHWMPAEGGTMMGVSRTVNNGKTTEWEFLIIREGAKGLEYVAKPSGQPEATFTVDHACRRPRSCSRIPPTTFPKKIVYKRDGDALVASIEGPMNGQTRKIDFPYKKTACGM